MAPVLALAVSFAALAAATVAGFSGLEASPLGLIAGGVAVSTIIALPWRAVQRRDHDLLGYFAAASFVSCLWPFSAWLLTTPGGILGESLCPTFDAQGARLLNISAHTMPPGYFCIFDANPDYSVNLAEPGTVIAWVILGVLVAGQVLLAWLLVRSARRQRNRKPLVTASMS